MFDFFVTLWIELSVLVYRAIYVVQKFVINQLIWSVDGDIYREQIKFEYIQMATSMINLFSKYFSKGSIPATELHMILVSTDCNSLESTAPRGESMLISFHNV